MVWLEKKIWQLMEILKLDIAMCAKCARPPENPATRSCSPSWKMPAAGVRFEESSVQMFLTGSGGLVVGEWGSGSGKSCEKRDAVVESGRWWCSHPLEIQHFSHPAAIRLNLDQGENMGSYFTRRQYKQVVTPNSYLGKIRIYAAWGK